MIIEVHLQVTSQRLRLSIPQVGYEAEFPNMITLNPKTKRILGFAESQADTRQRLGERWEALEGELEFRPALGVEEADVELDKYVLWRFVSEAHQQARQSQGLRRFLHQMVDRFDVQLDIEGYERFSPERRQALEYFLQSELRARKLTINGKSLEIAPATRNLEAWLRVSLTLTLPYVLIGMGFFIAFSLPERNLPGGSLILTLAGVLVLGLAVETLGKAVWMVVMRRLAPVSYVRYFLPRLTMQGVTRWLAGWLLREP